MSFANIVWQERESIVLSSNRAIVHGMLDTWKRCAQQNSSPHEPDFIAGLVLESVPLLYDSFRHIFRQYNIHLSLASVFCHQTPKVKYAGQRKSCELGDLLIVHVHAKQSGEIQRNALLYQAKMSSKQPHRISSAEKHVNIGLKPWR